MAQFIAFDDRVEVLGDSILAFIDATPRGKDFRLSILAKHGIIPEPNQWYKLQTWLNVVREIAETVGEMNLFLIGTASIDNSPTIPNLTLENVLRGINMGYHRHHRIDGKVLFDSTTGQLYEGAGSWELLDFDAAKRTATMRTTTPYASKIEEGSLTAIVRKYKPADSTSFSVKIDTTKEQRSNGGNSCTYLISW